MKKSFKINHRSFNFILAVVIATILFSSCKKNNEEKPGQGHAPSYSSAVLDKWMAIQLRLMKNATGIPNQAFSRHFAYAGIAAYESLKPGYHYNNKWKVEWSGLTGLPVAQPSKKYYFPANVNAAMAVINKLMFPNASAADKASIDSLELALNNEFLLTQPTPLINESADFGKQVASAVFNWAETDGYKNASAPYIVPTGPGLWKPTPPAFGAPVTPYWGYNRPVITGSTVNSMPSAPVYYSTASESAFYQMVKQVYDISQNLTDEQKAIALFWRDVPGATSPGHWLSILQQVINNRESKLDEAALAYAFTGAAINDALISCFEAKYQYNLVRPVTYIREVMGYSNWSSFIGTPAHPEYCSAHSSLSAAAAAVLEELFGNTVSFTDHTNDYLGYAPRTYSSFTAIAEEAGLSRLYAGIHYMPSITAGLVQGRKIAANIFSQKK